MIGFDEVLFPSNYDYSASLGPGYNTNIVERDSGFDQTFPRWDVARRRYENVIYTVRTMADVAALKAFFYCRSGLAMGFRFNDYYDRTSAADGRSTPTATDQPIVQDSSGNWRLAKFYAGNTIKRFIFKPVNGSVVFSAGGLSCDPVTGIISGAITPPVTAGFLFNVPVRFDGPIKFSIDDYSIGSIREIKLKELIYKV